MTWAEELGRLREAGNGVFWGCLVVVFVSGRLCLAALLAA